MTDCINGGAGEEAPAHPRRQRPRPQPRRRRPYPRQGVVGGAADGADGTPAPSSLMMLRSSCPPSGRRHGGASGRKCSSLRIANQCLTPAFRRWGFPTGMKFWYFVDFIWTDSMFAVPFSTLQPRHVIKPEADDLQPLRSPAGPCRYSFVTIRSWGDRANHSIGSAELDGGFKDMSIKLRVLVLYCNRTILLPPSNYRST